MRLSTPANEPEAITNLRTKAFLSVLFLTPAGSQAAACGGIRYTTSADDQEIAPETSPFF